MSVATPARLARYIRGKKNVLVFAGYLCDEMELDGRKLSDYVAEISVKLGAPVAATGNTAVALKERGARAANKVALEVVEMLRYKEWRDPIMPQRPDLLVFVGYPGAIARALVTAAQGVETVVLGTAGVEEASQCLGEVSLAQYRRSLERLAKALAA